MNFDQFFLNFQDHLAPRLDVYEQAIYLYIFRHTRYVGVDKAVIGFKSARRRMSCGTGEKGKPMSEKTASRRLYSLQEKGCIEILDTTRKGRMIHLRLPSEMTGVLPDETTEPKPNLESLDFFNVEENRGRILAREDYRCFYCLRQLTSENYVIEHVVSRPTGDNSYMNVVAACRQCNNRKGSSEAEAWLRTLYREGFLDGPEYKERVSNLEHLRAGKLKPM